MPALDLDPCFVRAFPGKGGRAIIFTPTTLIRAPSSFTLTGFQPQMPLCRKNIRRDVFLGVVWRYMLQHSIAHILAPCRHQYSKPSACNRARGGLS